MKNYISGESVDKTCTRVIMTTVLLILALFTTIYTINSNNGNAIKQVSNFMMKFVQHSNTIKFLFQLSFTKSFLLTILDFTKCCSRVSRESLQSSRPLWYWRTTICCGDRCWKYRLKSSRIFLPSKYPRQQSSIR